ncbi:hypothetical protein V6N13_021326 [Hibiscus sabdariffa]
MGNSVILHLVFGVLAVSLVNAEDPYLYFTWTVTYGTRSILGVPQQTLQQSLGAGNPLPFPDGILINGRTQTSFSGDQGKTYMFRISNVGLTTSLNFRIQGHKMKLVEVEGSHVIQNLYDSLDVHVGQSITILVTLDQPPKDYYIVASTRFTKTVLTATAVLHYTNSNAPVSGPIPAAPVNQFDWSMDQARTYSFGSGQWTPDSRKSYNLVDALTRHTTQFYLRVWDPVRSIANEYDIPNNVLLCGKAVGRHP